MDWNWHFVYWSLFCNFVTLDESDKNEEDGESAENYNENAAMGEIFFFLFITVRKEFVLFHS